MMEKIIVHTIAITKLKEKHLFQISLPENSEAITGVGATCDKSRVEVTGEWQKLTRSSGILQLFVADTGEHFFTDDPKAIATPCDMQPFDQVFPIRDVPSYKSKFDLLNTWQPVHTTIVDGYYKDLIGNISSSTNYNVRVYLRIKLR